MAGLEDIRAALAARPPRVRDPDRYDMRASVALVVAGGGPDPSLLFIRRRVDPRDFWSGHTAFPGGRIDEADANARAAAERETREEVGIDLSAAEPLGRLDDLTGTTASLVVSGFVYGLDTPARLAPNHEVELARFVSLGDVASPERHTVDDFDYRGATLTLPAIQVFPPPAMPLWGLTYRFLELFMHAIGRPIPEMPWDESL